MLLGLHRRHCQQTIFSFKKPCFVLEHARVFSLFAERPGICSFELYIVFSVSVDSAIMESDSQCDTRALQYARLINSRFSSLSFFLIPLIVAIPLQFTDKLKNWSFQRYVAGASMQIVPQMWIVFRVTLVLYSTACENLTIFNSHCNLISTTVCIHPQFIGEAKNQCFEKNIAMSVDEDIATVGSRSRCAVHVSSSLLEDVVSHGLFLHPFQFFYTSRLILFNSISSSGSKKPRQCHLT